MAVRTIAPGGGEFSATTTWVEGIVPTSSDHVVGDASSGNLLVSANYTIQYMDLTNYTGQIDFKVSNRVITLGLSNGTTTIGSGTTWNALGTGAFKSGFNCNVIHFLNHIGTTQIPRWRQGNNGIRLLTDSYFSVYIQGASSANNISGATVNMNVYELLDLTSCSVGGVVTINALGNNMEVRAVSSNLQVLVLNGTGTYVTQATMSLNGRLIYSGGTFPTTTTIQMNYSIGSLILQGNPSPSWNAISINPTTTGGRSLILDNANINNLRFIPTSANADFTISGTSNINNFFIARNDSSLNSSSTIKIATGSTINITDGIEMQGYMSGITVQNLTYPSYILRSGTSGVQAALNINTYNQNLTNISIIDMDFSGGNDVYVMNASTLTNNTNLTSITLPFSSGGGGQSAYTFFS